MHTYSPPISAPRLSPAALEALVQEMKQNATSLGFQEFGIVAPDLSEAGAKLNEWLQAGYHGQMTYMYKHGSKRYMPDELVPGTVRVICVGMHYFDPKVSNLSCLNDPEQGYIARYALGRDYHKLLRNRLTKLAKSVQARIGNFGYRVFVDSAPVMEKSLAVQAGLGWQGKNTLLINRRRGSWLLLGEIYVDLPLPVDPTYTKDHCSRCTACMDVCPTGAFVAPYVLDANRCLAYLTIENKDAIPLDIRPLMGNRIFGCDDCQLVCPWNRSPQKSQEPDFKPRHGLDAPKLLALFAWSEQDFDQRTQGSPIRRTGYEGWLRNIAVAIGNGKPSEAAMTALMEKSTHPSGLVREHVTWAIAQLQQRQAGTIPLATAPINAIATKKLSHLA